MFTGQTDIDPIEYMRRHASKNSDNKAARRTYIEEPNEDNPYYWAFYGTDKKHAGRAPASEASGSKASGSKAPPPPPPPPSSNKARDARRADKVVAQEEARAKDEARAMKPGKPEKPGPKAAAKAAGGHIKVSITCILFYLFTSLLGQSRGRGQAPHPVR